MDVSKILDHLMNVSPGENERYKLLLINRAIECFRGHKNNRLLSIKLRNDYSKYKIYRNDPKKFYYVILEKLEKFIQNDKINRYDINKIEEWLVANYDNNVVSCP